jgi:GMP synthase (glutamine-hydrolysing)
VLRLPAGAVRLASNPWDMNQAVRFGPAAWGVQFHPEFDSEIVREYIAHYRGALAGEGQDPARLAGSSSETDVGPILLRRFVELTRKS